MDIYKKRIKKYKKRVKMALLVLYSVKKVNEGIGVWLHFGYSLNEEAATSFLSTSRTGSIPVCGIRLRCLKPL